MTWDSQPVILSPDVSGRRIQGLTLKKWRVISFGPIIETKGLQPLEGKGAGFSPARGAEWALRLAFQQPPEGQQRGDDSPVLDQRTVSCGEAVEGGLLLSFGGDANVDGARRYVVQALRPGDAGDADAEVGVEALPGGVCHGLGHLGAEGAVLPDKGGVHPGGDLEVVGVGDDPPRK